MSTQALTGLRDYLTGTLSVADMNWLAAELKDYADRKEAHPKARRFRFLALAFFAPFSLKKT